MRFSVPEMSCGHCKASVENAVLDADDGAVLEFDMAKREVEIDSVLDAQALVGAIIQGGFEATPTG
jgi:copper chaperone